MQTNPLSGLQMDLRYLTGPHNILLQSTSLIGPDLECTQLLLIYWLLWNPPTLQFLTKSYLLHILLCTSSSCSPYFNLPTYGHKNRRSPSLQNHRPNICVHEFLQMLHSLKAACTEKKCFKQCSTKVIFVFAGFQTKFLWYEWKMLKVLIWFKKNLIFCLKRSFPFEIQTFTNCLSSDFPLNTKLLFKYFNPIPVILQ